MGEGRNGIRIKEGRNGIRINPNGPDTIGPAMNRLAKLRSLSSSLRPFVAPTAVLLLGVDDFRARRDKELVALRLDAALALEKEFQQKANEWQREAEELRLKAAQEDATTERVRTVGKVAIAGLALYFGGFFGLFTIPCM